MCVFKSAAWQVMIKALNKMNHPPAHFSPILSSKSVGPGCEQTAGEDKAFRDVWLLSACAPSLSPTVPFVMQRAITTSHLLTEN